MEKKLSVLICCYGNFPDLSLRAVESVLESGEEDRRFALHVGAIQCGDETGQRLRHLSDLGKIDSLVETSKNINKDPMMRLLLDRVDTDYVLWLDDDSHAESGWDQVFYEFIDFYHPFDAAGAFFAMKREEPYKVFLTKRPWFVSVDKLMDPEFTGFAQGGAFLVRTAFAREHDFPDRAMIKKYDDLLLGDLVDQQDGTLVGFTNEIRDKITFNDGERRGSGEDDSVFLSEDLDPEDLEVSEERILPSEERPLPRKTGPPVGGGVIERELRSKNFMVLNDEAKALRKEKKYEKAIEKIREALRLEPKNIGLHFDLASTLREMGKKDLAIASYKKVLDIEPTFAGAFSDLGLIMLEEKNFGKALHYFQEAAKYSSSNVFIQSHLALVLSRLGRSSEAVYNLKKLLKQDPGQVGVRVQLAEILVSTGQVDEALLQYRMSLSYDSDNGRIRTRRTLLLLSMGEYCEGWREFEQRKRSFKRSFEQPEWDGSELKGRTILLICEQGINDSLQFVRFVKEVQQRGGKIVLECQTGLKELFSRIPEIHVFSQGEKLPLFDTYALLMSLPFILGTSLETIPHEVPYLPAPNPPSLQLRKCSPTSLKVGVVWQYTSLEYEEGTRACQLREFKELFLLPGITWFSLQREMPQEDRDYLNEQVQIEELGSRLRNYSDLASIMDQLDLIVAIDSEEVHLAGALGKRTLVLLSKDPTWQWLRDREDSPWYPTFRLFRQQKDEKWPDVFKRLKVALKELIASHYDFAADAEAEWVTPHNYAKPQQDKAAYEDD